MRPGNVLDPRPLVELGLSIGAEDHLVAQVGQPPDSGVLIGTLEHLCSDQTAGVGGQHFQLHPGVSREEERRPGRPGELEGGFDGDQGPAAHRVAVGVPGPARRLGCHDAPCEGLTAGNNRCHHERVVPGHLPLKVLGAGLQDPQPGGVLDRRRDVAEVRSALGDPVAVAGPTAPVPLPSASDVIGGRQGVEAYPAPASSLPTLGWSCWRISPSRLTSYGRPRSLVGGGVPFLVQLGQGIGSRVSRKPGPGRDSVEYLGGPRDRRELTAQPTHVHVDINGHRGRPEGEVLGQHDHRDGVHHVGRGADLDRELLQAQDVYRALTDRGRSLSGVGAPIDAGVGLYLDDVDPPINGKGQHVLLEVDRLAAELETGHAVPG